MYPNSYGCESKLCMERSAVFRTYGTKGLRSWSCSGPLECERLYVNIYICICICILYIYIYIWNVYTIHLKDMNVEATHAGCRWFSLLICATSLLYTCSTMFNAGLPCMASARALDRTQPVASVTHWQSLATMWSCPLSFRPVTGWVRGGTWVVQVWNGYGTVWNRVWNETAHSSTAQPPRSKQFLDCQLAAAKRISTIKHHSCATAGSNCKWCRRKPATGWEGGRVTSNPFLDCRLAAAKHIPSHNKVGSSCKCCRHRLANTITWLGHSKCMLACMHSCMYVRSCMRVQM